MKRDVGRPLCAAVPNDVETIAGTKMVRRVMLPLLGVVLVLALAGGLFLIGLNAFARHAATMEPPVDPPRTEAIVVLTGGSNRLATGFTLLAEDRGDRLFVTGVHRDVAVADLLLREGIDPTAWVDRVAIGQVAMDTAGNASETAEWLRGEGLGSLALVTSNYHMPRSLLEFRRALPEADIVPYPVTPDTVHLDAWWRWPGTAGLIATEYVKYLLTAAIGRFRPVG